MSEEISENSEVYNHYLELSKPTEEDFKRVFTEEELKELCLKHKCRVNMWRWNIVNEYRTVFTESGRYQRWSSRDRLRMLAKAVNKMKPSVLYDEEETRKTRRKEWEEQLKENILSLNFWKRQRLRNPSLVLSESDDIDREIQSQCAVNTESMNAEEMLTPTEAGEVQLGNAPTNVYEEVNLEIDVTSESINVAELMTQFQTQQTSAVNMVTNREFGKDLINTEVKAAELIENVEGNVLVDNFDDTELMVEGDSEDSVETVLQNENQKKLVAETLNSEEVAPDIQNIYDVNTISMTIDSQMSTQSQDLPVQQSPDVLPPNYENFKNIIPLTSTQSQGQGSEDVLLLGL